MADTPTATRHKNSKVGQVVSRSGNKTIVVEVTRRVQHPLYKRFVSKSKKFYAHDEQNQCLPGDRVRIVESRPLSALKRWRLDKIVHRSASATIGTHVVEQEVAS
jgi:small subunit ribosomal protein S17